MAEYIEREPKCGDCIHADLCERITILKNFNRDNIARCKGFKASADVVEVVHGEWIAHGYKWRCSVCNCKLNLDGTPMENGFYFCPNCGAKMDGERRCEE